MFYRLISALIQITMPATVEAESPTGERNELNFFEGEQPGMQRLKSVTNGEHRRDSIDSGNSSPTLTVPTMRRMRVSGGWIHTSSCRVLSAENFTQIRVF